MKKAVVLLALIICYCALKSQVTETDLELSAIDQALSQWQSAEEIVMTKLNINADQKEILVQIPGLTESMADQIIAHRKTYGGFKSIWELQALGEDFRNLLLQQRHRIEAIETMRMAVSSGWRESDIQHFRSVLRSGLNMPHREAVESTQPLDLLWRMKWQPTQKLEAAMQFAQDPGEAFKRGPDFRSLYVAMRTKGKIESLVVGDYQAQLGQGLLSWGSFVPGRSATGYNNLRIAKGVLPYRSAMANIFMRGVAITYKFYNWRAIAGIARQKVDARIDNGIIVSFDNSGLHRTASEILKKESANRTIVLFSVARDFNKVQLGFHFAYKTLDYPGEQFDEPYRKFQSILQQSKHASFDFKWRFGNSVLFCETASTNFNALSAICGITAVPARNFAFDVLFRHYEKGYTGLFPNAFGSRNTANNESGVFVGLEWKASPSWIVNVYRDFWTNPWLNYAGAFATKNHEQSVMLTWKVDKKNSISCRFFHQNRESNSPDDFAKIAQQSPQQSWMMKTTIDLYLNDFVRLRSMLINRYTDNLLRAVAIAQILDLTIKKPQQRVSGSFRITRFSVDEWSNRIYVFETGVPGQLQLPALSGSGQRFYLLLHLKLFRGADLSMRWGVSNSELKQIGEKPLAKMKHDVSSQISYSF